MTSYKEEPLKVGGICLLLVLVFGGLSLGGGHSLVYQPLQFMWKAKPVDGTVWSAKFEDRSGGGPGGDEYRASITYRYDYEGEIFTSDNLSPSPMDSYRSEFRARDVLSDHPPGKEVTVYVDPDDPSRSFLIKNPLGLFSTGLVLVSVLLALAGLLGLVNAIRTLRGAH